MMNPGADPFGPPVIQPQGYYQGTFHGAPMAPSMAVTPVVPQTTMNESLPTY